ncbi:MAG: LPS export ABC transporter periplasmic protein LptC [Legionella sp.]|nr:MAG: LPS export ABC transporter periplasmic protein LptC [Legionella sp.]
MMSLTKQSAWWGLILLSTMALAWQWMHSRQNMLHLMDSETLAKTTNIMIYDLTYRQFDIAGDMIHFLETPLIQHIPIHNTHLLSQPHIIVTEPNQEPWDIRAEHAKAIEGGKEIAFQKNVRIRQHKPDQTEVLLNTEHLTYFPKQKKAVTDDEVTLTQAGNKVQSKGLIANMADNNIRLLSNARGHYVPQAH